MHCRRMSIINPFKLKTIKRIPFLIKVISSTGFNTRTVLFIKWPYFPKSLLLDSKLKVSISFHAQPIKSVSPFSNIHLKGHSSMKYKIESLQVAFFSNINFLDSSNQYVKDFHNIFNTLRNGINKFFKRNYL